jgi:predicted NAD/FAD-dependent oxidoreductase
LPRTTKAFANKYKENAKAIEALPEPIRNSLIEFDKKRVLRGQMPLVYNEVAPMVDWLIGTERRVGLPAYREFRGSPIERVAAMHTKPGRTATGMQRWFVEADARWSAEHADDDPAHGEGVDEAADRQVRRPGGRRWHSKHPSDIDGASAASSWEVALR